MAPDYSKYPTGYRPVLQAAYEELVALQGSNGELFAALEACDRTATTSEYAPLSVLQTQELYALGILTIENYVKEPYHVALYWMRQ